MSSVYASLQINKLRSKSWYLTYYQRLMPVAWLTAFARCRPRRLFLATVTGGECKSKFLRFSWDFAIYANIWHQQFPVSRAVEPMKNFFLFIVILTACASATQPHPALPAQVWLYAGSKSFAPQNPGLGISHRYTSAAGWIDIYIYRLSDK